MVKWMQLDRACFRTHGDTCGWLRALAKNPRSWAHLYIPICHYVLQYNECIIQYIHIQILISHGISTYIPSISHQYNQSKLGGTHTHTYIYSVYNPMICGLFCLSIDRWHPSVASQVWHFVHHRPFLQ